MTSAPPSARYMHQVSIRLNAESRAQAAWEALWLEMSAGPQRTQRHSITSVHSDLLLSQTATRVCQVQQSQVPLHGLRCKHLPRTSSSGLHTGVAR